MLPLTAAILLLAALQPGDSAPALDFKDMRYLPRSLDDLGPAKAYALVFLSTRAEDAASTLESLAKLDAAYSDQGVILAGFNAEAGDSIMDIAWHALKHAAFFPMLKDVKGDCAKALGISRTPAVALLDAQKILRYRGNIDGLTRALDALLAGSPVEPAETEVQGNPISFWHPPAADPAVSYTTHIAPLLQAHCVSCHRDNGQAPFALDSFTSASGRANMIAEVVSEGRMPPWYAHPAVGDIRIDRHVPEQDRTLLLQWIANGKPEGDPALAPAPVQFADTEWQIDPDLVVTAKQDSVLPATGFIPYQYVFLPKTFDEDTYVQAIQIKGSNPTVLHHANLFYSTGGFQVDQEKNFLTGYVPGGVPSVCDDGVAFFIPKGATLGLQIHHVTTGKLERSRVSVALQFPRARVDKLLYYRNLDGPGIEIPPHARAHRVSEDWTLPEAATGVGLFGHMHLRGRDMTFYAHYPYGASEPLMTLPNYNFNWQITYNYPPGQKRFPAGTRIECVSHYDNSAFNPYNPDPAVTVRDGPQTVDEMMNGFFVYTKDAENLALRVNPETGHAIMDVAANQ